MAFKPKDALSAARDIATNSVQKASDIVESASHIISGDIAGGTSAIVEDSIGIGTYAAERVKEMVTGADESESLEGAEASDDSAGAVDV